MGDEAQMAVDGKGSDSPAAACMCCRSLFTAGNMAAGFYAITQSIQGSATDQGYFDRAALALGIAVLFDGLDGIIARMTNTTSDFGKELDSLADVVTFGVAPSLLAYIWGFRMSAFDGTSPSTGADRTYRGVRLLHLSDLRSEQGWRGSISVSIRSLVIRVDRERSTSWVCRFRRVQA